MGSKNIRVVVRIRPENEVESTGNHKTVVQNMDDRVLVFDPKEEQSQHFFHGNLIRKRDITKRQNKDLKFAFDYVFAPLNTNRDVFEETTKSVLDGVLDGYNSSVFAYGATGAGKTHTMLGKPEDPGVTFLTVMELYQRINALKSEKTIEVAVSYLEVYNEKIRDLLLPNGTLPIREDGQHGVVVQGLSLHKPKNADELMHMLAVGNENRSQHPTDANSESSRSHAVFQVFVRQKDRTANVTANLKMAKLSLIDLAGSERATMTKNMGLRFREGANINRSLLALGNVINALADNKVKAHHIPYRNSKLTRLLKDSLGGNCQTVMIAAVSPSSISYEDTYNTLKYADRAKHIKAELKENVFSVNIHVSRYAQIVEELRKEITELKSKLQSAKGGNIITKQVSGSCLKTKSFQDKLCQIFTARVNIRKELLEFESSTREIQWKIVCKNRKLARLSLINSGDCNTASIVEKIQRCVESNKKRLVNLNGRRESVMSRMSENTEDLQQLENEMNCTETGTIPQVQEQKLKIHHLEVEVLEQRRCTKYLKHMIKSQEREAQLNDRLISGLLQMVRKQYYVIKGHGLLTSDLSEDFIGLQPLIDGVKEVRWADQSSTPETTRQMLSFSVLSSSQLPATPSPKPPIPEGDSTTPGFTTVPPVHTALARLQEKQPVMSPPVTTYAGRTPLAKHFVTVHGKSCEGQDTTSSNITSHQTNSSPQLPCQDLDVTYVCTTPSVTAELPCAAPRSNDVPRHGSGLPLSSDGAGLMSPASISTVSVNPLTVTKVSVNSATVTKVGVNPLTVTKVGVNPSTVTKVGVNPSAATLVGVTPVTKGGVNSGTVTTSGVNSNTVTKLKPSLVVKALRFETTPPKADMTFADAVKSPARTPLRPITDNNCMSPLAVQLKPGINNRNRTAALSGTENFSKSVTDLSAVKKKTNTTLKRFGIPSMSSQTPDPKNQARRINPRYMQSTKATAYKRTGRTNTGFDENRLPARRVKKDMSVYNSMRFRSQSVPSLNSNRTPVSYTNMN